MVNFNLNLNSCKKDFMLSTLKEVKGDIIVNLPVLALDV